MSIQPGLEIIFLFPSTRWREVEQRVKTQIRKALKLALKSLPSLNAKAYNVTIVFSHDQTVRTLNAQWRGYDKPTNVLSFPAPDMNGFQGTKPLGDIILGYQTIAREARESGKDFIHHTVHLAVHGFLHLAGFDHDTDHKAKRMEQLEIAILNQLGINNPYKL